MQEITAYTDKNYTAHEIACKIMELTNVGGTIEFIWGIEEMKERTY